MTKTMPLVQITDWQKYRKDGEQFLKTANGAYLKKKNSFSPETLYNLICMGMEKLIMAFLMKNGDLAENHTMSDLSRALEKHIELPPSLHEALLILDTYQEICDLETYSVKDVHEEDIPRFLSTAETLKKHLHPELY